MKNLDWLYQQLPTLAKNWLNEKRKRLCETGDIDAYATLSAQVRRAVGTDAMPVLSLEHEQENMLIRGWSVADATRILLLATYQAAYPDTPETIKQAYTLGDDTERCAIMRGLWWLDPEGQQLDTALQACRANSLDLFSAIALHNYYPARFFPERAYNQLCMKALFQGLSAEQIIGLPKRGNRELSRMGFDFAQERIDAHRNIPPSLWLAIAPAAQENAQKMIVQHLRDDDTQQRYGAALAILRSPAQFASHRNAILSAAQTETVPEIRALLNRITTL